MPDSVANQQPPAIDPWADSALDAPLRLTVFRDASASQKQEIETTLRGFIPALRDTHAPSKAALPWVKLATFGDERSDRGSLRHNHNVTAVYGIEGDYDGERLTMERARQVLLSANIAAIIYTSPSNRPDAPRWRILCPTSRPILPANRAKLMSRLNGLFVGALAAESFTLSQSYYFGHITGSEGHTVIAVDGRAIDEAAELDAQAVGRPAPRPAAPNTPGTATSARGVPWGIGTDYACHALAAACEAIRNASDGAKHHTLNKEAWSIGGLVGGGELNEDAAWADLAEALEGIRDRCADFAHAERTLKVAFADGKANPRPHSGGPPPVNLNFDPETGEVFDAPAEDPEATGIDWGTDDDTEAPAAPPPPKHGRGLRILSMAEVEALPPPQWLIDGLIPAQGLVIPYGPPKAGKTFIVLAMALHIAAGLEWEGKATRQGAVVYVVGEGLGGFATRLAVMRAAYGIPLDAPFYVIPRAVNFREDKDVVTMVQLARQAVPAGMPIALIVIDTLARAMPGVDENSAQEVGLVIARCDAVRDETGATIMPIHHSGKDVERGMRGSNAILGAVDASLLVQTAGKGKVRVINDNQKDGEPHKPLLFRMETVEVGFPIRASLVPRLERQGAVDVGRPESPDKPTAHEMLTRVLLVMNEAGLEMMKFADVAATLGCPSGRAKAELGDLIPIGRQNAVQVGAHRVWKSAQGTAANAPQYVHREAFRHAD
jgi:hypothetical protein